MATASQADLRDDQCGAATPLLEFRNIRIVYDNAIEAIRDISIAVPEGGIVALLGSNGAGKSTLLKAMSGILYTEEGVIENGVIRFRDRDVHRLAPDELVRRGVVQVPEGRRVFAALSVFELLGFFPRVNHAMDHGDVGQNRQHPQHRRHRRQRYYGDLYNHADGIFYKDPCLRVQSCSEG